MNDDYLEQVVIPNFMTIIDQNIFSTIVYPDGRLRICTNLSANYMLAHGWEDLVGISYADHQDSEIVKKIFKDVYNTDTADDIHEYCSKIRKIQEAVVAERKLIYFVDMLPYNGQFKSFLMSYVPIFNPTKEVIALQSYAIEYQFFGFQHNFNDKNESGLIKPITKPKQLSRREHEILYLLTNNMTQEQIAQLLGITRGTVASVINNQLSGKFNINGSNTKMLIEAGLKAGYHRQIPHSLWRPSIIILDDELAQELAG